MLLTAFNLALADVVSLVSMRMWAINFSIVPDVKAVIMFLICLSISGRKVLKRIPYQVESSV
jgi:hypothetical protein